MFNALRKLFQTAPDRPLPAVPPGQRIYAVGDVHGRADLFAALIESIESDDRERDAADTTIILLGDLVDRGPESCAVVEAALNLAARRKMLLIAGNHEEMFLRSLDDLAMLRHFLRYGGRETVLSYPIDATAWNATSMDEAQIMLRDSIPPAHLALMHNAEDWVEVGDYLFVHAGIAPGVPLEQQRRHDLRWIREPFLSDRGDHGHVIVHGHSITAEPEVLANRIGIDTGAFASGRLTALGLESTDRWLIATAESDEGIAVTTRAV